MSSEATIEVEGIVKHYGEVRALDGVDLQARPGRVLGLLGPNGAGKTTLVRMLATLIEPDAGTARVTGLDVVADAARVRERIGLAGQYAAVDENLTGLENLTMVGRLYGAERAPRPSAAAPSCSSASSSATRPTGRPRPTPAACAGAWTSRPRSSPNRPCCSSTSRRPGWTRAAASACGA